MGDSTMNDSGNPTSQPPEAEALQPVSRRSFVVAGVAAAGTLAVAAGAFGRPSTAAAATEPLSTRVVLADPTLCIGCLACEVNCAAWHASVGRANVPRIHVMQTPDVKLQPSVAQALPARSGFTPQTCRQCPTAWCLPNCPTNGLQIDPKTGNRYINEQACIGCGKCEVDCPVEWKGTLALKNKPIVSKRVAYDPTTHVYAKCDLCQGRTEGPICVERCPVNLAIRKGTIKSDHLCLDLKPSTPDQAKQLT